jgi:hypothetical protein
LRRQFKDYFFDFSLILVNPRDVFGCFLRRTYARSLFAVIILTHSRAKSWR